MIKPIQHSPEKTQSPEVLLGFLDFISDPSHDDNSGKQILPARNYRCADQSKEAFMQRALDLHTRYCHYRQVNRLPGASIKRLIDHIIYSCAPGTYLTAGEREDIETMIVDMFSRDAAIRTIWHTSSNGRADLHVIITAKAPKPGNSDVYEVVFGRFFGHAISIFRSCDSAISSLIHSSTTRIP